ncbi:MAG TPA: glycosyltransferase [Candidatus Saccharimonadales bacterium]|nr:glycosyltransferase [Candidatus Saccharimonadales bacterium]
MSYVPTVIIPCLNEEKYVGRVLGDLARQSVKPAAVFVVDCHSTDKTVDEAKKFAGKLPLKVYQSPYRSAAAARNTGATHARSDYLLFLDADVRLRPEFIERLAEKAEQGGAEFISPKFRWEGHHPVDAFYVWCENVRIRRYYMGLRRRPMGLGGGLYIKKSRHDDVGGYADKMREFDDVNYCKRLGEAGVHYAYAPQVTVVISSRRFAKQGRFKTMLQLVPTDTWAGRHLVRPVMKRLGIPGKWDEL